MTKVVGGKKVSSHKVCNNDHDLKLLSKIGIFVNNSKNSKELNENC